MDYGYIVNEGEGRLRLYTRQGAAIRCIYFDCDRTVKRETVSENTAGSFFVGEGGGRHFIVYRQADGVIALKCGELSRRMGRNVREDIQLSVLMSHRKMRLIYKRGTAVETMVRGEGEGSAPTGIDEAAEPYRLIPVVRDGYALLYKRKTPEAQLCYREITVTETGEARALYTTGFDIGDSSLCTGGGAMHFAFISMSRFALRVMYVRREDGAFTRPKTLWEGSRCSCLCIACDGSEVFVWWEASGHIFESVSHDLGESFSQSMRKNGVKIRGKALHLCGGCHGISEVMLTEKGIYAPKEVKELIYGRPALKKESGETENTERNTVLEENLKAELARSREQIERLSDMLKSRGDEAIKREQRLRKRIRELEEENCLSDDKKD